MCGFGSPPNMHTCLTCGDKEVVCCIVNACSLALGQTVRKQNEYNLQWLKGRHAIHAILFSRFLGGALRIE
jgi:hypothetical protein